MDLINSDLSPLLHLPLELSHTIIKLLDFKSLGNLSLVNRQIRNTSIPFLFKTVSFTFSSEGLSSLRELATSPIAQHVKSFRYYSTTILIPGMKSVVTFLPHSTLRLFWAYLLQFYGYIY